MPAGPPVAWMTLVARMTRNREVSLASCWERVPPGSGAGTSPRLVSTVSSSWAGLGLAPTSVRRNSAPRISPSSVRRSMSRQFPITGMPSVRMRASSDSTMDLLVKGPTEVAR